MFAATKDIMFRLQRTSCARMQRTSCSRLRRTSCSGCKNQSPLEPKQTTAAVRLKYPLHTNPATTTARVSHKTDPPHLPLHHLHRHHDRKSGQDDVEELLPSGLEVGPKPPLLPFRLLAPVQLALLFRRRRWRWCAGGGRAAKQAARTWYTSGEA